MTEEDNMCQYCGWGQDDKCEEHRKDKLNQQQREYFTEFTKQCKQCKKESSYCPFHVQQLRAMKGEIEL